MALKTRVGILFGGRSAEHEVSVRSARSVVAVLDPAQYEVVPIGISKSGTWHLGDTVTRLIRNDSASLEVVAAAHPPAQAPAALLAPLDVVFPVLHGPYGEDGTMQGLLELANVPYVGAGVTASAVAMDKVMFKKVMRSHGFPITPEVVVMRHQWESTPDMVLDEIEAALAYPVFVKPANMGSSVGISKCSTRPELTRGLREASRYDRKLVVEQGVPHVREIEVSVLGNDTPQAAVPGEVRASRGFYDYASKYLDEGDQASQLLIPAPLTETQTTQVRQFAVDVYAAIDCAGMARVDFLLNDATGEFFISEVNTIPGFTSISLYPRMWEAAGLSYADLITRLLTLAMERHRERQTGTNTSWHD